jgi:hypothetical protein
MKKILLFAIAIAIFLSACEDKNTPEPTPDPKPYVNKFNCKINGKYWEVIPKELHLRPIQSNTLMVEYYIIKGDTSLSIWADNELSKDMLIVDIPLFSNSNLSYNSHPYPYSKYVSNGCSFYLKDTLSTNKVELITYDKKNKIIKGIFNFTAVGSDCNDTIRVTGGYFDISY